MRLWVLVLALLLPLPSVSEDIIVNIEAKLPKVVSADELREYFLLKKVYFPNGIRVQVYIFNKDTQITRNFLFNVLHVSPSAYFDMIDQQAASGRSNLPIVVESDTRMIISVAVNKGGLGVVRDAAYAANINKIQILEVKQ